MSELILVPVPGSTTEGEPVVRVVVVPRLDEASDAASAGLDEWPATLAHATFQLSVDDADGVDVRPDHDAEGRVWRSFFGSLRVEGATTPDFGDPPEVRTTSAEVDDVEQTYRTAAQVDVAADSGRQANLGVAAAKQLRQRWSTSPDAPPAAGPAARPHDPDFHSVLAMLREHPAVMRRLGLVFDLKVPSELSLGERGTVRVRWRDRPAGVPDVVSPRSAYEVDDERGLVPGRTATTRAGLVDLGDTESWTAATVDVDNAVVRLRQAAASIDPRQPAGDVEEDVDGDVRLPALRTAGIQLVRKGRADEFARRRTVAAGNARRPSVEDAEPLTADDLTLGLRFDVRLKDATTWTSLVRREARYTVDGAEILPPAEEEGHVKPGAAVRHGDGVLRADEIVARWNGWSLAVPSSRPGSEHADRRADLPFDFAWEFEVPRGSLLPLRFGSDYHLRARIADLAGGGVDVSDDDMNTATDPIPYLRLEPVAPPTVSVPEALDDLGPGGSLDTVVIRDDAPDYPRNDERILAAPSTTLDVAEHHGMLNDADEQTLQHVRRALAGGLADPASAGITVFVVPEPGGISARTHFVGWGAPWPDRPDKTIRLVPRHDDDPPVDPEGATNLIRVRLAPGEQATLALSSFLENDFLDHLALTQWRTTSLPVQMVKDGRHPMATPANQVTFVHAVRRQPDDPAGSLTPMQEPNGVSAVLVPDPPLLGADPTFSQQVQLTAAWTEVTDDESTPMTGVAVQNLPLARGDDELGQIVHQLGDTRHRMVTYSFAAVSRFRHFFRTSEDAGRFVATGSTEPISIKSTARPAVPAVRAVVPAFIWTSETTDGRIRHVRSGGTLRVELMRPWHLTGQDEQLAVVVEATEVSRDPIWTTAVPERQPAVAAFAGVSGEARHLPDGTAVTVAAYDAAFTGDWWVADVDLPAIAATSYRPFVRLAVARYQRESLPGLELSDVVLTDPVQLLPERTVSVEVGESTLTVRVDGLGPDGPNANRVDVVVETRSAPGDVDVSALTSADGVDVWVPEEIASGMLGETLSVARPTSAPGTVRVRVREVEILAAPGHVRDTLAGSVTELEERVVLVDLVPIP